MTQQTPFIGRLDEIEIIEKTVKKMIENDEARYIICIEGEGGIGKTRLIQEVYKIYERKKSDQLIVAEIIDFDDQIFHTVQNVILKILEMPGHMIRDYLRTARDYQKIIQIGGLSFERIEKEKSLLIQRFTECFNTVASTKKNILFFDTIDNEYLEEGGIFWLDIRNIMHKLKNVVILLAGRNAKHIGKFLQSEIGKDCNFIELKPLSDGDSRLYLERKEKEKYIPIEDELKEKLLCLTSGKPILIDLAVEMRAREILSELEWLVTRSFDEIKALKDEELEKHRQEFEKQLVIHVKYLSAPMNKLIFAMSHVYPLNVEMINVLFEVEDAQELYDEAISYVFVKSLPNKYISLHDEMRRMINNHIWKVEDYDGYRRREYSKSVIDYLENEISTLNESIDTLERQGVEDDEDLVAFKELDSLKQKLWILKKQHFENTLYLDTIKGLDDFARLFDEATDTGRFNYREALIKHIQEQLPSEQTIRAEIYYELDIRYIKYLLNKREYSKVIELANNLLRNNSLLPDQHVEILIQLGNANIREGNVDKGILNFKKAVFVCDMEKIQFWSIKAINALGWACGLTGNSKLAIEKYKEAQRLCIKEEGQNKKDLEEDYGWILNNLAYELANEGKEFETAMMYVLEAIKHWEKIGNKIGLGAAYFVKGIVYHLDGRTVRGVESFENALKIFEPLKFDDWLGQVYSWRGALYYDMGKNNYDIAINNLQRALEIGSPNIEAMTRCRLGRVYIAKEQWGLAEDHLTKSIECAEKIPDYRYWLAAIARLIIVSVEKGEFQRLGEFEKLLDNYLNHLNNLDNPIKAKNIYLGIAYLALARLALKSNDETKADTIAELLNQAIHMLTAHGYYAGKNISDRLYNLERKDFGTIQPEIIRMVGEKLCNHFINNMEDVKYRIIMPIINNWAQWK